MQRWCLFGLLQCLVLLALAPSSFGFTTIVAFGDSNTDTGNLPSSPPDYWNGRFSNGPVWLEYLCGRLGLNYDASLNYAVSGDESDELGLQINNFPGTSDGENTLFVIWSGDNDFENHLSTLGTSDTAWENRINQTLSSILAAGDLVYQKGARHLLLFNESDITRVPQIQSKYSASFLTYVRGKIQTYNARLRNAIPGLLSNHPGLNIYFVELYTDLNYVFNNYAAYGFTHITPGALNDPGLTDSSFSGPGADYLFWDGDHFTTKAHAMIAGWVANLLPQPSPPTISITSPVDGAHFDAPANISLSADVQAGNWPIQQVAFYGNGTLIGAVSGAPYMMPWPAVPAGGYTVYAEVTYGSGQTVASAPVQVMVNLTNGTPPPAPWQQADVGAVGFAGAAAYASNGTFSVSGSGTDIWGSADSFHFLYQPLGGDVAVTARVTTVQNTDGFAKACVMIRDGLDPGAANALMFLSAGSGTGFQARNSSGAQTVYTQGSAGAVPYWLKVERHGTFVNGYTSPDGVSWTLAGTAQISFGSQILAGLAVTSHNNTALNTSTFDRVQVVDESAPPVLSLKLHSNGYIELSATGAPGSTNCFYYSTNLLSWIPFATNVNTTGVITLNEAVSAGKRFYRAGLAR